MGRASVGDARAGRELPEREPALDAEGAVAIVSAEDRLRQSEERFRGAFDNAPIGMALVAPDGQSFIVVT